MAEENTPQDSTQPSFAAAYPATDASSKAAPAAKPAAAKKEKPPALEDKPFQDFMKQDFLPSLTSALKKQGLSDIELEFERRKLEVIGSEQSSLFWHVVGQWNAGQRRFNIAFLKEDITGQKIFSYADGGTKPSTLEQFMGDERKVTLDLLLHYTLQRLNGQKWLTRN